MSNRTEQVTKLLRAIQEGEARAADELLPLVYEELRSRAGLLLGGERRDHTLQRTPLVHEAYLKLVGAICNTRAGCTSSTPPPGRLSDGSSSLRITRWPPRPKQLGLRGASDRSTLPVGRARAGRACFSNALPNLHAGPRNGVQSGYG